MGSHRSEWPTWLHSPRHEETCMQASVVGSQRWGPGNNRVRPDQVHQQRPSRPRNHGQWRDPGQHGLQSVRRSVGWGGDRTRPRRSGVGRHARGMHGAASVQDRPGHGTCDRHGPWRRTIHSRREGEARHGRTAARAPRHPGPARARRDADGPAARVRAGSSGPAPPRTGRSPSGTAEQYQPAVHRGVHGGGPGPAWRRAGAGGRGSGSGYAAAVLSLLAADVYGIELEGNIHARSAGTLARLGYRNIHLRHGDGFLGWPEAAAVADAILLSCAAEGIPQGAALGPAPRGRALPLPEGNHAWIPGARGRDPGPPRPGGAPAGAGPVRPASTCAVGRRRRARRNACTPTAAR